MSDPGKASEFRLPLASQRTIVIGRTGGGKTVFVKWLLSRMPIETMPWVVVDYKHVGDYTSIPHAKKLKTGVIPKEVGLHVMQPDFNDDELIDAYLFEIMRRGNIGLVFDEGASIPQREPRFKGLKTVLAQGRAKRVPVIFASQRPRYINKSLLSEGDFFAKFNLSYYQDEEYMADIMSGSGGTRLAEFHSYWYDVGKNKIFTLAPVNEEETLERFDERLRTKRRFL